MSAVVIGLEAVYAAEILQHLCDENRAEFAAMDGEYNMARALDQVMAWREDGAALVLLDDGMPQCMGGIRQLHPGVAIVWFVGVRGWVPKHVREVTRLGRDMVRAALENGYHRLEGHALSANRFSGRWYRRLGFELDGVRRAFGRHGEDIEIYGVTSHGHG